MKIKRLNIIFIFFSLLWLVFFARLLFFGEYELYVNPALKPFFWLVFIFFMFNCFFSIKENREFKFEKRHLIFLAPFLILFFTRPQPLGSQTLEKHFDAETASMSGGYYRIENDEIMNWDALFEELTHGENQEMIRIRSFISNENKEKIAGMKPGKEPDNNIKVMVLENLNQMLDRDDFYDERSFGGLNLNLPEPADEENDEARLERIQLQNRRILEKIFGNSIKEKKDKVDLFTLNKDRKVDFIVEKGSEFYTFWSGLERDSEEFLGKKVSLKGRFFRKDDSFLPNQAYISRLVITCCAAHAIAAGVHIESDRIDGLENDQWIEGTGILVLSETKRGILPVLKLLDFEKVQTESPYIYPTMGAELPSLNLAGGEFKPANSFLIPIILAGFLLFTFVVTVVGDE